MLFRIITWFIVLWLVGRFLTRFVFPIVKVTSATSRHLRDMQDQINDMNRREQEKVQQKEKPSRGEYIDYEELK
jgi:hypothetical protein